MSKIRIVVEKLGMDWVYEQKIVLWQMNVYSNTDGFSNTNAISTMKWLYDEATVKSFIIFLTNCSKKQNYMLLL